MSTRSTGAFFEHKALLYLHYKKYKLIEQNYHAGRESEIDLIMFDGSFIVFVEVKSLRIGSTFSMYETMTRKKKRCLQKGILNWLLKHNHLNSPWRLDFIGIIYKNKTEFAVEHIQFVDIERE